MQRMNGDNRFHAYLTYYTYHTSLEISLPTLLGERLVICRILRPKKMYRGIGSDLCLVGLSLVFLSTAPRFLAISIAKVLQYGLFRCTFQM